jgi:predicted alpha/beta-fold hydrolase
MTTHSEIKNHSNGDMFIASPRLGSTPEWCDVNGKFAVVTHGWLGSCDNDVTTKLVANLRRVRGGCILCMDYRNFSRTLDYIGLVGNYYSIQTVLVNKLTQLKKEGFQPIKGYMNGYSFGANLVINSAILAFGNRNLGMIDGTFSQKKKEKCITAPC